MNKKSNDIDGWLSVFDSVKPDSLGERRMACKPLYDFFQVLLKEIGVTLLGIDKNSLRIYHLKTRWENIKIHLNYIEDPKCWDSLINEMHNIRRKVEHDDYYDPKSGRLKEIRKKAPEFKDWLVRVAQEYFKKSKNFTFKEAFYKILDNYTKEAEWLIAEYGENIPHAAESDYSILEKEEPYLELKELIEPLHARLKEIGKLEDLERSDIENLIKVVKVVSQIRGREEILLRHSICPKCGGKIIETQHPYGGTVDDPEPTGFIYRVGCEKCDYEVHSENISI